MRISRMRLWNELGADAKFARQLPLTVGAIGSLAESRVDFALRRLQLYVGDCVIKGVRPATWEMIRRAGLVKLRDNAVVVKALEDAQCILDANFEAATNAAVSADLTLDD